MPEIKNGQMGYIYTPTETLKDCQLTLVPKIYSMPYDAINRESTNSSVYTLPLSSQNISHAHHLGAGIHSIQNSPEPLTKKEHFYANSSYIEFGMLAGALSSIPKPQTMLISVPFQISEDLVCYGHVSANYVRDMSSTNSTLLYSTSRKGQLVVKDFGADAVIHEADRMYQQVDATMEVYIATLGRKLDVNVPKSWMLTDSKIRNTTVISEYIEHQPTEYPHLIDGFSLLPNNHSFIKNYHESKLPVFHYLINHPHAKIAANTYANIIVREDSELFSIDHEGCLKPGRSTPRFTARQINQFLPDQHHYEMFKNMNLTDEVNTKFGPIVEGYNKKITDITALSISDFEFRKQHLLALYEEYNGLA